QYPPSIANPTSGVTSATCPPGANITLGSYISQVPSNPTGGAYDYYVSPSFTDYVLHTTLESANNAALQDSLTTSSKPQASWASSVQCNDSTHLLDYCVGSK